MAFRACLDGLTDSNTPLQELSGRPRAVAAVMVAPSSDSQSQMSDCKASTALSTLAMRCGQVPWAGAP
jgi:hypothetical protein